MRLNIQSTPILLVGDMGSISDEMCKKGAEETRRIKGVITFSDGSKSQGTREMVLGDPYLRIGEVEVEGMFQPEEYYDSGKECSS